MATSRAPALPMFLMGVGFLFIYAGVKDRNPLQIAKDLAQGKNPAGGSKGADAGKSATEAPGPFTVPGMPTPLVGGGVNGATYSDPGPVPSPPISGGGGSFI